jgi:hypothetical protein
MEQKLSEARIQEDVFKYIRNQHPETHGCLWHCPNGGARDARSASFLTSQGVVPGVQDLHFIWMGGYYVIELKTPTGEVSCEQKFIHAVHALHGRLTYIFITPADTVNFIETILSGQPIDSFKWAISPFADPKKVDQYREEMREERKRKLLIRR